MNAKLFSTGKRHFQRSKDKQILELQLAFAFLTFSEALYYLPFSCPLIQFIFAEVLLSSKLFFYAKFHSLTLKANFIYFFIWLLVIFFNSFRLADLFYFNFPNYLPFIFPFPFIVRQPFSLNFDNQVQFTKSIFSFLFLLLQTVSLYLLISFLSIPTIAFFNFICFLSNDTIPLAYLPIQLLSPGWLLHDYLSNCAFVEFALPIIGHKTDFLLSILPVQLMNDKEMHFQLIKHPAGSIGSGAMNFLCCFIAPELQCTVSGVLVMMTCFGINCFL